MLKLAAPLAALVLLLTGCSQARDPADTASAEASRQAAEAAGAAKEKAAKEAAEQINQAKARASQGVADAIRAQLCLLTQDGSVSPADLKALPPLLDHAARTGVSPQLVTPLRQAVAAGGATKAQVSQVQRACSGGS